MNEKINSLYLFELLELSDVDRTAITIQTTDEICQMCA